MVIWSKSNFSRIILYIITTTVIKIIISEATVNLAHPLQPQTYFVHTDADVAQGYD